MARDYKNAAAKKKAAARPTGSWVSFTSGLGLGLVVALAVYVMHTETLEREPVAAAPADDTAAISGESFDEEMNRALPEREFDFYKILPEIEVKVPDWELTKPGDKNDQKVEQGTYVLQVGSYKQYEEADRAKAELALRGIQAKIHRVVINGQDVWYRVHLGPYTDVATLQAMRAKLTAAGNDFILLKIGGGAG